MDRELSQALQRIARLEKLVDQLTQPKSVARLMIPEIGIYQFKPKTTWASHKVNSDIYSIDGADMGFDKDVYDYLDVFASLTTSDYGYCLRIGGVYYAIQAPCP